MSILIKNTTVVTQNENRDIIRDCDILITNNKIEQIGKNLKEKAEFVIDGSGKISIPGLINMHTHVGMTSLRGLGEDLPLHEWLNKKIWPQEAKLTSKEVYEGARIGVLESFSSGVTCINEMYLKNLDQIAEVCAKEGMRATISLGMLDLLSGRSKEREFSEAKKFISNWSEKTPLVSPAISCHSVYTCSKELLIKAKEFANKNKLKFHIHVSETRKEIFDCLNKYGKYPIEFLDEIGLIDQNTILAHASWVTKREIAIVAKKRATIVNCPISNLKLATGGVCPVREYYEQGANVTLGTDGAASNNSLNMFETIKISSLLQKHHYWKADVIPTQAFLDFATINGAKALGINAGSIEKGKLADVVLLERSFNMQPENDLISNIVYSANPSNVSDVIVNGRVIVSESKLVN